MFFWSNSTRSNKTPSKIAEKNTYACMFFWNDSTGSTKTPSKIAENNPCVCLSGEYFPFLFLFSRYLIPPLFFFLFREYPFDKRIGEKNR